MISEERLEEEFEDIGILQDAVAAWAIETFGESSPGAKILHLWEELDEAHIECHRDFNSDICEEIADAGMIVMHMAGDLGIELPEVSVQFKDSIRKKLAKNRLRTWGKPDENGVVRHVKEAEATS